MVLQLRSSIGKARSSPDTRMRLDLTDEETFALLNLLVDTIEADRYPMSRAKA